MKPQVILSLILFIALSCQDGLLQGITDDHPNDLESTRNILTESLSDDLDSPRTRRRRAIDVPFISFQGQGYDKLLNDALAKATNTSSNSSNSTTTIPTTIKVASSTSLVTTTTKAAKTKRKYSKKAIQNVAIFLKKKFRFAKN